MKGQPILTGTSGERQAIEPGRTASYLSSQQGLRVADHGAAFLGEKGLIV